MSINLLLAGRHQGGVRVVTDVRECTNVHVARTTSTSIHIKFLISSVSMYFIRLVVMFIEIWKFALIKTVMC